MGGRRRMTSGSLPVFGCIEAGGTKFVLGVVRDDGTILHTARIPTRHPSETIAAAMAFFQAHRPSIASYAAFGIASFGPVDLDRSSPLWGHVVDTPKPGWSGTDLAGPFARGFDCPVGFDTDVNGAALSEWLWGGAVGVDVATYVTVGTGIGGGAIIEGRPLHGARHPEMGHMRLKRHVEDMDFAGTCPFHGDCLEGMASGPAIVARWGASLSDLPTDHLGKRIIAYYLAQAVIAQQALLSPRRIILGGGVMDTPGLLETVREAAAALGGGYFDANPANYDNLIVAPGLGSKAGLLGALALAQRAGR